MKSQEDDDAHATQQAEPSSVPSASTSSEKRFACLYGNCPCVYSSKRKMQSHFMKRHPNKASVIADLKVFLQEGVPLPQLPSDDEDVSSTSSSSEDEEEGCGKDSKKGQSANEDEMKGEEEEIDVDEEDKSEQEKQGEEEEKHEEGEEERLAPAEPNQRENSSPEEPQSMEHEEQVCPMDQSQVNVQVNTEEEQEETTYSCEHCTSQFTDQSDLKKHLQTHTDERRNSCSVC